MRQEGDIALEPPSSLYCVGYLAIIRLVPQACASLYGATAVEKLCSCFHSMERCPPGKFVTGKIGDAWCSNLVAQRMLGVFFELGSVRVNAKANTTRSEENNTAVESFVVLESLRSLEGFSQGDDNVLFDAEELARLVQTPGSAPLDRLAYAE